MFQQGLFCVFASAVAFTFAADSVSNSGGGVYSQPAPEITIADKETHYSQPLIENPAYDPSLYTSFVPQDAVQQYVSHYGGPYAPAHAPAYYGGSGDPGFAVQTGYEGYLVPTLPASSYGSIPGGDGFSSFAKIAPVGYGFVKSLVPILGKVFFGVLAKLAIVTVSTLGIIVAGGLVTSLLCAFTPVCKLTFAGLPFLKLKDTAKQLTSSIEAELTQDRVKRAAEFVRLALEKYSQLQEELRAETEEQKDTPVSVAVEKKNA